MSKELFRAKNFGGEALARIKHEDFDRVNLRKLLK